MLYAHRWDLGNRGKLFMVTEETTPKGTVSLGSGYEGRVTSNPKKVIKLLEGVTVSKEIPEEKEPVEASGKRTIANFIRMYAHGLKEKE